MVFEDAMKWMRRGKRLTRFAWHDERQFVFLSSGSQKNFIFKAIDGNLVRLFLPTQEDLTASDWSVIYADLGSAKCKELF